MDRHPGGLEHSRYMLELAFLPSGSRWLDMGAGDGSTMNFIESQGTFCEGIDLCPRGPYVRKGSYLHMDYLDGSFDGVISQCSFYLSGDPAGAFREAARVLRRGGRLVYSDVCYDGKALVEMVRQAGFSVRHIEDLTPQWRDYYLEALWSDDCGCVPRGKGCSYLLLVCERM